jgi:hypothetical protein
MKSPVFDKIKQTVKFFSNKLRFNKFLNKTGRKLAISINDILSLSLYKAKQSITTKQAVWNDFKNHFNCTYKTFVVNINRWYFLALIILILLMKINRKNSHLIKHIDSTEIPVCLFKNAHAHRTMKHFAEYRKKGNTTFYGLKLHIITDLKRNILSIRFTGAGTDDREVVIAMSKELTGIFVADAGYISKKLSKEFYQENKRILFAKPRSNMKKIMTEFQEKLYSTRMLIELNFRSLKMFYGLITSLPRSVDGYFANYIYALLAYQIS